MSPRLWSGVCGLRLWVPRLAGGSVQMADGPVQVDVEEEGGQAAGAGQPDGGPFRCGGLRAGAEQR